MDDQPLSLNDGTGPEGTPPPPGEPAPAPPPAPPPERYPFWGYSDVFLFAGLAIPAMLLGAVLVKAFFFAFGLHPRVPVAELLPQQFLGYAFLFGALTLIFRVQYDRPLWSSLAWRPMRLPFSWVVISGLGTALLVGLISTPLGVPNTSNPMTELMSDRTSVILLAIFGITVGPLCEELAFRGFLQPLLVRSLGAVPGIIVAALPFGLLHYREYGYSWKHALLISGAGAAFGWMRHATGSTRASTVMHSAYNALFFFAFLAQKQIPGNQ